MNKDEFREMERLYNAWLQQHPKGDHNYKSFSHMRRSVEFAKHYHAMQVKNLAVVMEEPVCHICDTPYCFDAKSHIYTRQCDC